MQWLLLQTFAWMTGVGLIGAMLGCMAHRFFAGRSAEDALVPATAASAVVAREGGVPRTVSTLPAAASAPLNKSTTVPVVEASKAPAPVAARSSSPVAGPVGSTGQAYTYPITTIGIPRANPELVQPQIQQISLPPAASVPAPPAPQAAVVVVPKQIAPAAPAAVATVAASIAPAAVTIRQLPIEAAPPPAAPVPAVVGEPAQPRPEPLRPELARSPTSTPAPLQTTPIASSMKPPLAPAAPAASVSQSRVPPFTTAPATQATVAPVIAALAVQAKVAPAAPAPVILATVASVDGAKPLPTTPEAKAATEGFTPVAAGGAALAALAARAAEAAPSVAAPLISGVATAGDDLMRIRSVDAALQDQLKAAGVTRFSEIARWSQNDVTRISTVMGVSGRIEQENWIEQAQILATGGETEYSRRRARGEVATSVSPPASKVIVEPALAATPAIGNPPSVTASVAPTVTAASPLATAASIASPAAAGVASVVQTTMAAGAAASAAAAAMAAAAASRATANFEPSMPAKLGDAIRENFGKPNVAQATADVAATPPGASQQSIRVSRPDLAGLRSVRSEALRDVTAPELLRSGGTARSGGPIEDLKRVRGIGVLIEKKLNSLGVVNYEQIANWTNADIDRVSQILDFKGRIERESWVEQARILASGGNTEFSKRVDRGEA